MSEEKPEPKVLDPEGEAFDNSPLRKMSGVQTYLKMQEQARKFEDEILAIEDPLERRMAVSALAFAAGNLSMAFRVDPVMFTNFFQASSLAAGLTLMKKVGEGLFNPKDDGNGNKVAVKDADLVAAIREVLAAEATKIQENPPMDLGQIFSKKGAPAN